ncbi:MAG: lytic murein transglycosylase [Pseudomonadota bacterium]
MTASPKDDRVAVKIAAVTPRAVRLPGTLCRLLMLFATICLSHTANADFATCKEDLVAQALATHGEVPALLEMLAAVEEIPRVTQADREQPEFVSSFADYYRIRVSQQRVDRGRQLRATHSNMLEQIYTATGVQPHVLLALWGLETNFGGYMGKLHVPSALATLACGKRRGAFFRGEFAAVANLVANGDMQHEELVGSWAGAMGHMQFMPSTYAAYAIDADQDGRRNVYSSLADAITSGANYLHKLGWQPGFRWGREILLPEDFDYAQAHINNWQPLRTWREQGVEDVNGRPLADLELESAILVPMGHRGPAFVVYPNFRRLMEWNRSANYALSVGRLADRIAGLGKLARPLSTDGGNLTTQHLVQAQNSLTELGYSPGAADGLLGPATRRALRAFQTERGLIADGYPSPELVTLLLAEKLPSTDTDPQAAVPAGPKEDKATEG